MSSPHCCTLVRPELSTKGMQRNSIVFTFIPSDRVLPLEKKWREKWGNCIVQVSNNHHHGIELFLMCTKSCSSDWTFSLLLISSQVFFFSYAYTWRSALDMNSAVCRSWPTDPYSFPYTLAGCCHISSRSMQRPWQSSQVIPKGIPSASASRTFCR